LTGEGIDDEVDTALAAWIRGQIADGRDVRVEVLDRSDVGHSAETLLAAVTIDGRRDDVVVRLRPPEPGLLEPYDLGRQFTILRALEPTPVRAPRARWHDGSGVALGRELYVMERLPGEVYERGEPDELAADPERVRRMCEAFVDQLAAIHLVDLDGTGLGTDDAMVAGRNYVDRELEHWAGEIERVKRGPLPALERLVDELRHQRPDPNPTVTLVHGDAKPGNFAFVGDELTAVFDWELATLGDPRADLGWAEVLWTTPGSFTTLPGAFTTDEVIARWEGTTGLAAEDRAWYRAMQTMKMAVILLVGGHLFDAGHRDDLRFLEMAYAVRPLTQAALHELGIDDPPESGPVLPRKERIAAARAADAQAG
jgi:aminoglycoside phosphotransferase (APT) family kinase protein